MPNFDPSKIVLNRKPMKYDHRDFRLADYITPEMRKKAAGLTWVDWPIQYGLNQGATPHCVGFAYGNFGVSCPVEQLTWTDQIGHDIYYKAKEIDGEPGAENGSTTRSGVQAFMSFAKLDKNIYAFASSMEDIIVWLLAVGPVITGTNWYSQMMNPDSNGRIHVGGYLAGGHEWMISGVNTVEKWFHCTNSWGEDWGINGQFTISFDDYQRLLNEQGDAVTTAEVAGAPEPPPEPIPNPGCLPKALYWLYKKTL
jgi:hypothetical protein